MKKVLILLLVAAVGAVAWFMFKPPGAAPAEAEDSHPTAKVVTVAIADEPIAQSIVVFGTVGAAPSGERVVAAPFDGVVLGIRVGEGATVAAGDVLLQLAPSPDTQLMADSARSQLALARQALAAVQQRIALKLATNTDLLAAEQAVDEARLKVDSFSARGLGGNGLIVAPVSGVVTKINLSTGTLVATGTALVTVSTAGQLEARLGVEADEVGQIVAGQTVRLESSNRSDAGAVAAMVRTVGAALDPVTGTAEVRVPLPAGAPLLFGEHVRARIELQRKEHALVVPRSAVLPDDGKEILFTVKDGKAVRHEVKLGLVSDALVEVIGGNLHAGDTAVTLGNYELEDGMAVQPPAAEAKP